MDLGPGLPPPLSVSLFWPLLVLFLGAAALVAWRWLRSRREQSPELPLTLRARVELSPQHVLYVVEAADRCLLLGGAPGGLSLLTELELPATPLNIGSNPKSAPLGDDEKELAA